MNHLVIYNKKLFGKDYIALMLSGEKTFGSKFTTKRTAPYQKLQDGDYLYLKESSGPIRGRVRVKNVANAALNDPEEVMTFLATHMHDIGIHDEAHLMDIWQRNAHKKYVCYWAMESPEPVHYPVSVQKNDRRVWVAGYEPTEEVSVAFL